MRVEAPAGELVDPTAIDWDAIEGSRTGCEDADATDAMCAAIDQARLAGESLGGVFEIWCWGVCPGLGGYATYSERLDGRLLGALGSIPAVKGVRDRQTPSPTPPSPVRACMTPPTWMKTHGADGSCGGPTEPEDWKGA